MRIRLLVCLIALGGCFDNPFGRPTTISDGSEFPEAVQGNIAPQPAFLAGNRVTLYLLGEASPQVGTAVILTDPDGNELPSCQTRQKDEEGRFIDLDLESCQGSIRVGGLPDQPDYSPFVWLWRARVDAGYPLNSLRSHAEVVDAGLTFESTDQVANLPVLAPGAEVADPSGRISRLAGWKDGIRIVYLDLDRDVPTEAGQVLSMDLLVPEGASPGAEGTLVRARQGDAGYSPLCRVSYYQLPDGAQAGDVEDAEMLPADSIRPSDPPQYLHCLVP